MRWVHFAVLPPIVALLTGCVAASGGRYPSLAPRAIEKRGFDEPARPASAVTPDPALDTRLATQTATLDRLAAGFTAAAETARRDVTAASRAAGGSEPWLTAQAGLARLDDWRAQTTALAAEIEAQGSARAAQLQPPYPALETLRERAAAEADRQATTAAALQAALPAG